MHKSHKEQERIQILLDKKVQMLQNNKVKLKEVKKLSLENKESKLSIMKMIPMCHHQDQNVADNNVPLKKEQQVKEDLDVE